MPWHVTFLRILRARWSFHGHNRRFIDASGLLLNHLMASAFYFLITYRVCKKRMYCNRMSEKKKFFPFDECSCFVWLRRQKKQKKFPSVCLSFHVDTETFEGISGSKQNLLGVFYVWNVGLELKSEVISWSWFWPWFWTEFWFSQKLCGATPNLVDIFSI